MNIQNINSTENENSQIISKLFNSLNIKEYEPNTLNCMNEFIKSYIKNILKEAKKNMILAKREKITIEDVESAVNTNQNNMYKNMSKIHEMKFLADKLNSIDLPFIPESPVVLKPPINNNLLRNNFQIYSDTLNKQLIENKNNDINFLGNKRNIDDTDENKNNSNNKKEKNKGKKSMNQELKKLQKENKGFNPFENNNKESKKVKNLKEKNVSVNSDDLSSKKDELNSDNDDEMDFGEDKSNKKEDDDMEENDDSEDEESEENENMDNNESNNNEFNESSYSKNNNEE